MKVQTGLFLAALAAVAVLPAATRADVVDVRLNSEMPKIMEHLKGKGYKNVGVLRFQVQKGKGSPRFDNAPYNGNLPIRLENMLVIHGGPIEKEAIGVIHDAGVTANKAKIGDWLADEKQRKKLFDLEYPLAWGKKKVTADAFLTGLVKIDENLKNTTFTITCFSKDDLKPKVIKEFTLKTTTDILRDMGASYVLSPKAQAALKKVKKRGPRVDEFVQDAVNDSGGLTDDDPRPKKPAKDKDKGDDTPRKPAENEATPSSIAGLKVTVLVDGKEHDFSQFGRDWQLKCPPEGKSIEIQLHNISDKRLGVVLKLNGFSTFNNQIESPEKCRKWVIDPGKKPRVKGFMIPVDNGTSKNLEAKIQPFKVIVGDEARAMRKTLGDKTGLLEIDVFAESGETVMEKEDALVVSARGLPPSKDKLMRGSYKALRSALLTSTKLMPTMVAKKEVIVPDDKAIGAMLDVPTTEFTGYNVGRLAVQIVPAGSE